MRRRKMAFLRSGTSFAWLAAAIACGACDSTPATGLGGQQCTYHQVISCTGQSGCAGTRICLPDLSGFAACECGDGRASDAGRDATGDAR